MKIEDGKRCTKRDEKARDQVKMFDIFFSVLSYYHLVN